MICRYHRCSLLGMPHGNNIRIVGDGLNGIRHTFSFGRRGTAGSGKAQNGSAQFQHRRLKGKSGSCGRLEKESRQLLMLTSFPVLFFVFLNLIRQIHQMIQLFNAQIQDINNTTIFLCHFLSFPIFAYKPLRNPLFLSSLPHLLCLMSSLSLTPTSKTSSMPLSRTHRRGYL